MALTVLLKVLHNQIAYLIYRAENQKVLIVLFILFFKGVLWHCLRIC